MFPATITRRSAALVLLVALLWLVAAAGLVVAADAVLAPAGLDAAAIAALVAGLVLKIAAPLAVVVVAVELLRRTSTDDAGRLEELQLRNREAAATTTAIRESLIDVDATLAAVAGKLDGLRASATEAGAGLVEAATRLEGAAATLATAGDTAGSSVKLLAATIPDARQQADSLAALLAATGADTARQLEQVETLLAAVWARNVDATGQVTTASATMAGLLAGIENASVQAGTAIDARVAGLGTSVDTALGRAAAMLDAAREGVTAHAGILLASVDQSRATLEKIAGDTARTIAQRLDRAVALADDLGQKLGDQDARSRTMVEVIERSFAVLDAKIGHAATMSYGTLDGIAARMTTVREQVNTIGAPIAATGGALLAVEATVQRLGGAADHAMTTLGASLPAHREAVAGLVADIGQLAAAADALEAPVARGRQAIADAGTALDAQRAAVEVAAERLILQFDAARAQLAAIEDQTDGTTLASSNQLIDVLARVREVANATAGTMRATLAGVVAEAEAALDRAGSSRAEAAFAGPVRAGIAEVEAASERAGVAAQAVADRIAQRLLGLTRTVATVEARIEEADARYDERLRDDLALRSAGLVASLNAGAIDIARVLGADTADDDWRAYLTGDRGRFARRAARLVDGGTARAIARQFRQDPVFAEQATRYIDTFEALIRRVDPGRAGEPLAVTLVSSDLGKLYVALAQSLDRLP